MAKRRLMCAVLASAMLMAGCDVTSSKEASEKPASLQAENPITEETAEETTDGSSEGPSDTTAAPAEEAEPFVFNPYPHIDMVSSYISDEKWDSLYNMIDAIRAGEDTFECADEEAYKWCTHEATIGLFMPAACVKIEGGGYEDGIGKLQYNMDKEDFLKREMEFEEEITGMINEAIRTDYSDFEKTEGIYCYVCKHFQYDYSDNDGADVDEFSNYACLMTKQGICSEVASSLAYLLMQCGVEAVSVSAEGTPGYHAWTYVRLGDNGYHLDATWGLYGDYPYGVPIMTYFMMTEEDRIEDGFDRDTFMLNILWEYFDDCSGIDLSATDDTFSVLHDEVVLYKGIDTDQNIILYTDANGRLVKPSYGDI